MSDIFISYARKDRKKVKTLVRALERVGLSVWWDRRILAGRDFSKVIEVELGKATCVVVLWSKWSVGSDWVKEEADIGKSRGILVPALIEDVEIPFGYKRIQAARLVDWKGTLNHPEFEQLLTSIRAVLYPDEREEERERNVELVTREPEPAKRIRGLSRIAEFIRERHMLFLTTAIGLLILAAGVFAAKRLPRSGNQGARLLLSGEPRVEKDVGSNFYNISFEFVRAQRVDLGNIKFEVLSDTDYEGLIVDVKVSVEPKTGTQVQDCEKRIHEDGRSAGFIYAEDADNHTLTVTVSSLRICLHILEENLLEEPIIWSNGVKGRAWYKSISAFGLGLVLLSFSIFGASFWARRTKAAISGTSQNEFSSRSPSYHA